MLSRARTTGLAESQAPRCSSRLKYWGIQSRREVHWYHDARMAGGVRDRYEVYRKEKEFGQSEITDADRYPHLYWNIWRTKTSMKRVIDQFGYSKELKPEKLRYEAEKLKYFRTLDSLNFIEFSRGAYSYIDNDARGAVGYLSEDEVDELQSHTDFGKMFCDASEDYRREVLRDPCDGRPVYEWQVPYGLDEAFGYRDVATAVDIVGNKEATENMYFDWRRTGDAESEIHGTVLENPITRQRMLLCDENEAAKYISNWKPDTVVFQRGAEKMLHSLKRSISPTNPTDMNGCFLLSAWTAFLYWSPLWPDTTVTSAIAALGFLGANAMAYQSVFLSDQPLKKAMSVCAKNQCDIVFGDWLADDYDERQHWVKSFDELAMQSSVPSESRQAYLNLIKPDRNAPWYSRLGKAVANSTFLQPTSEHPAISTEAANNPGWMKTYKDAVNDKRMDILAHVSNNVDGGKILVCTRAFDNVTAGAASALFEARMTGAYRIDKPPLDFDNYFERVSVVF